MTRQVRAKASHQMVDALLMVSMWKSAVIRGIAVMHDGSRIARAEDGSLHLDASARIDSKASRSVSHHDMKPSRSTAHLPPCFISDNPRQMSHRCLDAIDGWLATAGDAKRDLRGAASRQLDFKRLLQRRNDLPMRQASRLVQTSNRGLQMRSQLHGRGSQRIRRLQGPWILAPHVTHSPTGMANCR